MKIMKRTLINAFTFARAGRTEDGASCIIWHNYVDSPEREERMVLDERGRFVRLERRRTDDKEWHLSPVQGSARAHDELLDKIRELGWNVDEVWLQPVKLRNAPGWDEMV